MEDQAKEIHVTAADIGAQHGDTIESLNDVPLKSVTAAYAASDAAVRTRVTFTPRRTVRGRCSS